MNSTEFPQRNLLLRAGNNPNTNALPLCLCSREDMPGQVFYLSKWELDHEEVLIYKARLLAFLSSKEAECITAADMVEKIAEILPPTYLCVMNQPPPVMVLAGNPIEQGWMKPLDEIAKALSRPNSHPGEN